MAQNYKSLLLQSRIYQFIALIFAVMGVIVLAILYDRNIEGRLLEALQEPATIFLVLFPFTPAIVLSIMARGAEKKYLSMKPKTEDSA